MENRNMSIKQIVEALQKQALLKRDFIVPAKSLIMDHEGNLMINLPDLSSNVNELLKSLRIKTASAIYWTTPNNVCHEHFSEKLKINKQYYDRMKEGHTDLLHHNVNYWLNENKNSNYLLRTFINPEGDGGIARAFLSDTYKPIDNWDVAISVLDAIKDNPGIRLEAADITERKMYMRFIDPTIQHNAPELLTKYRREGGNGSDGIIAGFVISNSEVGEGAFSIAPRALILACSNGMTRWEERMRKVHLGTKLEQGAIEWSEKTRKKNLELIQAQTYDAVKTWISKDYLVKLTGWLTDLKNEELDHPIDCTKNICSELGIVNDKVENILNRFINSADISPFGIAQAVTEYAHIEADADEQFKLEGKVLATVENYAKYDYKIKK